jgi:hypothetical protein
MRPEKAGSPSFGLCWRWHHLSLALEAPADREAGATKEELLRYNQL